MSEATLYRSLKTDGIQRRLRQPTVTRNCSTLLTESEVFPGSTSTGDPAGASAVQADSASRTRACPLLSSYWCRGCRYRSRR